MKITLYHGPVTCSLASRLALIESGLDFDIHFVNTTKGEHLTPEYLALNPAGKVPALTVDGTTITESTAILPLIAALSPDKNLMPTEPIARAEAQSMLGYLSSELHPCWTHVFRPDKYTDADGAAVVRTSGIARLNVALDILEKRMLGREYLLDQFSVCDLYLAVYLTWRMIPVTHGLLPKTPALDDLFTRVFDRPGLQAAFSDDMARRGPPPSPKAA